MAQNLNTNTMAGQVTLPRANAGLTSSAIAPFAQAIAAQHANAGTYDATTNFVGGLRLGLQELQMFDERFDLSNPYAFYASRLNIIDASRGSFTIKKLNRDAIFRGKAEYGSGNPLDIDIYEEVIKWNTPVVSEYAMSKFDLDKGVPNVLATKMIDGGRVFLDANIAATGKDIETAFAATTVSAVARPDAATSTSMQEDALKLFSQIVSEGESLLKRTHADVSEVLITLNTSDFSQLASIGRIVGDSATSGFNQGRFGVGTIGGFRVQASAKLGKTAGSKDIIAIMGTSDSLAVGIKTHAANVDRMGASSDLQTYLEMSDVHAVPEYAKKTNEELMTVIVAA